jgi:hypothetical protein
MTYLEKYMQEFPDEVKRYIVTMCCVKDKFKGTKTLSGTECIAASCAGCWNREIDEKED